MAVRRSTQLIIIGASVFIIGAGLVFLGLRSNDDSARAGTPAKTSATQQNGSPTVVAAGQTTGAIAVPIPKGFTEVAVKLDSVAGLAGHAKAGDLLNLYATVKSGDPVKTLEPPFAKLVLSNVRVLEVGGLAADGSGDPVYYLALKPAQAEQAIFFAKFESLWAALVPPTGHPATTGGIDYSNDLVKR
jgi:hypothetical protein